MRETAPTGTKEAPLPDLDALDVESLKALVLAQQSELDSHRSEIEKLKLFIVKLKRMQFGPRSEKLTRDIAQLLFHIAYRSSDEQ